LKKPFLWTRTGSRSSLAASVAIHTIVVVALLNVVFRYPLGQLIGIAPQKIQPERLQYIALPSGPTQNSGGSGAPSKQSAPAALRAPTATAPAIPESPQPDTARAQAAGGTGTGIGVDGSGVATGLVPRVPDPRIALQPGELIRTPRTMAQAVDSIMDVTIGVYNDSVASEATKRRPGDWTVKGKDGQVWGVDQNNIYLGKYKLPSAILALLPLNRGSGVSPIEARSTAYIRRDIMENAQRSISEDEFRAAVKRIRERKEREKKDKQLAVETKTEDSKPIPDKK
jgi:hypothetical protein